MIFKRQILFSKRKNSMQIMPSVEEQMTPTLQYMKCRPGGCRQDVNRCVNEQHCTSSCNKCELFSYNVFIFILVDYTEPFCYSLGTKYGKVMFQDYGHFHSYRVYYIFYRYHRWHFTRIYFKAFRSSKDPTFAFYQGGDTCCADSLLGFHLFVFFRQCISSVFTRQ